MLLEGLERTGRGMCGEDLSERFCDLDRRPGAICMTMLKSVIPKSQHRLDEGPIGFEI